MILAKDNAMIDNGWERALLRDVMHLIGDESKPKLICMTTFHSLLIWHLQCNCGARCVSFVICMMAGQKIMNAQNVIRDIGSVTACLQHHHRKSAESIDIGMALK